LNYRAKRDKAQAGMTALLKEPFRLNSVYEYIDLRLFYVS